MSARARTLLAATCLMVLALPVCGALAFIPRAERIEGAVARTNREADRVQALRIDITLRIEDEEPVGRGQIVTHPTGLARLELRGGDSLVERHLLRGTEHAATRNGAALDSPRAFLPPLFLLQADSATSLRVALEQLGADAGAVGLAPCGEGDCYVLGDPGRVPPAREPRPVPADVPDVSAPPVRGARAGGGFATVWVDVVTYEIKRLDSRDGARVWLGPPRQFEGGVRAPAWLRIDEPGRRPVRFDVIAVTPVDAAGAAFSEEWLRELQPGGGLPRLDAGSASPPR